MAGNYTMTRTYQNGDILTASDFVAEHINHITNSTPSGVDDYSDGLAQMKITTNPGDVGSESLATTLGGEIERLRFEVAAIKTKLNGTAVSQWYSKSYNVTVSSGSITQAKLATNATYSQFLRTTNNATLVSLGGAETTMVSQAITITRSRTKVFATVTWLALTPGAGGNFTLKLKRGATVLDTKTITVDTGLSTQSCSFFYSEGLAAGTYTYSLTMQADASTSSPSNNESEIVVEEVV